MIMTWIIIRNHLHQWNRFDHSPVQMQSGIRFQSANYIKDVNI